MCLQIHSAQKVQTLRQGSAGGGRGLFATISAFSYEPSHVPRASSFPAQSVNDENPAANIRSGRLPASIRLGRVRRNRFNGSPFSTLLERDCRESIKRPIGEAIRFGRLAGPPRQRWFSGIGAGVRRTEECPRSKVFH